MPDPLDHIEPSVKKTPKEKEISTLIIFIIGFSLLATGAFLTYYLNYDPVQNKYYGASELEVGMMLAGGLALIAGLIRLISGKKVRK